MSIWCSHTGGTFESPYAVVGHEAWTHDGVLEGQRTLVDVAHSGIGLVRLMTLPGAEWPPGAELYLSSPNAMRLALYVARAAQCETEAVDVRLYLERAIGALGDALVRNRIPGG